MQASVNIFVAECHCSTCHKINLVHIKLQHFVSHSHHGITGILFFYYTAC